MNNIKNRYLAFWQNTKGIAAVEFALILPLLMLLVFGSYGVFVILQEGNKIDRASAIVADLVSRTEREMTQAEIDKLINVSKALTGPLADDRSYEIILSSVFNEFDSAGNTDYIINWSKSNKPGKELEIADLDKLTLPRIAEGDSLIIVTTKVDYKPAFLEGIVNDLTFDGLSVRRPRFVQLVPFEE